MSNIWTIEELRRATSGAVEQYKCLEEKRRLLEKKTKILEEKARTEKLAVDKKLLVQILEEENRTHDDTVKELEDKIASLEQQMKPSLSIEGSPTPTSSESAQEISDNIDEDVNVDVPLQPEESTVKSSKKIKKEETQLLLNAYLLVVYVKIRNARLWCARITLALQPPKTQKRACIR